MKTLTVTRLAAALIATIGLCLPLTAQAQTPAPRGPDPFSAYDRNGDGSISPDEFETHRQTRMQSRAEEGRMMRNAANAPAFTDFDTNGDGKLSPEELAAGQQRQFMQRPRSGAGMGPAGGAPQSGMPRPGMRRNMPSFADFDLNGDGRIDPDEMQQARQARITERAEAGYPMRGLQNMPAFEDIDTDRNGSVSPEEFARHQGAQVPGKGR
jgi:Ca2+-binding EF-hand superfamily protein